MKYFQLLCLCVVPICANATGMAVTINNLYLQNSTNQETVVQIKNFAESANKVNMPARSMCKIESNIMFLPFEEESNNFVVMISTDKSVNPIVIDKFGLLALAADSAIKAPASGRVSQYRLFGFCANKYAQYQYLNVAPHDNGESAAPDFRLANCNQTSNYVYLINDQYVKVKNKPKYIDFSRVASCQFNH